MWWRWLILLLVLPGSLLAQQPVFRNFTMADGLPSSEVYDVLQDSHGYMWFAADRGVARYNGYEFTVFTTGNGLPHNTVFNLQEDDWGRIWMVPLNGMLCYFEHDSIHQFVREIPGALPGPKILYIHFITRDSIVGGLTRHHYAQYSVGPSGKVYFDHLREEDVYRNVLVEDLPNGEVAMEVTTRTTSDNFRMHFEYGNSTLNQYVWESRYAFMIPRFLRLPDGSILCGIGEHMLHFNRDSLLQHYEFSEQIIDVDRTPDGRCWLGVLNSGSHEYDPKQRTLSKRVIMPGQTVNGVCLDQQGSYWFTTLEEGAFHASNQRITHRPLKLDGELLRVADLAAVDSTQAFVGTHSGGMWCLKNGVASNVLPPNAINKSKDVRKVNTGGWQAMVGGEYLKAVAVVAGHTGIGAKPEVAATVLQHVIHLRAGQAIINGKLAVSRHLRLGPTSNQ